MDLCLWYATESGGGAKSVKRKGGKKNETSEVSEENKEVYHKKENRCEYVWRE